MIWSKENLLQLYVEGTLPSEANVEFDRLVKEDPSFCESLVTAVSQDLGPVPEATLDQMAGRLDARYDQIWKVKKEAPVTAAPVVRAPWLPSVSIPAIPPDKLIFVGGVVLFALLAFISLTNPFQEKTLSVEESQIRNFTWTQPAVEQVVPAPVRQVVRRTLSSPARSAASVPVKQAVSAAQVPMALSPAARQQKARELVELAMKSAPGANQWVETTGPKAGALVRADLPPLPDLPAIEETPSYVTAQGNLLRLSIPLTQAENVKVRVADPSGNVIRDLYSGYWQAGSHTLDWDVKDNKGHLLKTGQYNVLVEAGGRIDTQKVTIK